MHINHTYDELALFSRIAEGDEQAFKVIFSIYLPILLPTIRKLVKDAQVTDDIVQEVFLRMWIYRDKLGKIDNPRSWILRVTYNSISTYFNKEKKHASRVSEISNLSTESDTNTEEQLAYRALRNLIADAVGKLPARQKQVYQLIRNEGKTLQEVADSLNLSLQTVKNTLSNAIQAVRSFVEDSGYPLILVSIFFSYFF